LIVLSAYAPDFDIIANKVFKAIGINIFVFGAHIQHGVFHNIGILLCMPYPWPSCSALLASGSEINLFLLESALVLILSMTPWYSAQLIASFGR